MTTASRSAKPASTQQLGRSKVLVAYFTRSGNTRVIAGTVQRALGADLFEIRAADPYPEDYEETVARATRERDGGVEPTLAEHISDIVGYDTIFLGFPIWGATTPAVIRTFLKTHELRGKNLRPFITHGGYGPGNSTAVLASHAAGAKIERPLVMEADQERRTLNQVRGWVSQTK